MQHFGKTYSPLSSRYKERLRQTVADNFETVKFNGYVEGALELQAAPDSAHASADLVSLDAQDVCFHFSMKTSNPFEHLSESSISTGESTPDCADQRTFFARPSRKSLVLQITSMMQLASLKICGICMWDRVTQRNQGEKSSWISSQQRRQPPDRTSSLLYSPWKRKFKAVLFLQSQKVRHPGVDVELECLLIKKLDLGILWGTY